MKKYANKKVVKRYTKGKKRTRRTTKLYRGTGKANKTNGQIVLNRMPLLKYPFKGIYVATTLTGSASVGSISPQAGLVNFKINDLANYSQLVSLFKQYRINMIKVTFEYLQNETHDTAYIPTLYCRYNYDPNLVVGTLDEVYMENLRNCVKKKFITYGDAMRNCVASYKLKPATFVAKQIYGTMNYVPSPVFNQWLDFTGTTEIQYSGFSYFISNLTTGTSISIKYEYSIECRDPILAP